MADGKSSEVRVQSTIARAEIPFSKMKKLMTSKNIKPKARKQCLKIYIRGVVMCVSAETWNIRKRDRSKTEAFEMKLQKTIENIK